jgi:hypothetical protein
VTESQDSAAAGKMIASFLLVCLLNVALGSSVDKPRSGVAAAAASPRASVPAAVSSKEIAKPHPMPVSAVQAQTATNSTVVVVKDALQMELVKAEEEVQAKEKQMKVQAGLLKEKEVAASQAEKRAAVLRGRVDKLQKEADVAAEMAQEKSEAAAKAQAKMNATEQKAQQFSLEAKEMERVVNQTRKEELILEHNVSMIEQMVKMKKEGATGAISAKPQAAQQAALHPAAPQVQMPKATFLAAGTKVVTANTATTDSQMSEAYKKLMEENDKLKHEKALLEDQLNARKAATEKKKLKQKLKNRLALADRHMKMQKSLIRAAR